MENLPLSKETDSTYHKNHYRPSEISHKYGNQVHILSDPFSLTQLARLCHPETFQPQINLLATQLYRYLLNRVINAEFPRKFYHLPTRMAEVTPKGYFSGEILDEETRVVCVDIARAGILPSQICYDMLNTVYPPHNIRQDHLLMARVTGENGEVVGAEIRGEKIGGPIDGSFVLIPDPMGATGNSLSSAIRFYKKEYGTPKAFITLNLIVTPQFIRSMLDKHPEVIIYALRLDRGLSSPEVLESLPGEKWDEENGLTDKDYIVPGGGGFGEIMNNSFV